MPFYRRTLEQDLDRWIGAGLVAGDKRAAILASVKTDADGGGAAVVAVFGALLLGFAAISFVAANWGAIPDAGRIAISLAVLAAAIAAAAWLFRRGHAALGHAFALLAALSFGANIFLIAQAFNISAHYPRGALIWTLGAAATAWAFSSRPPLAFAAVIGGVWVAQEYLNELPVLFVWLYPPVWLLTGWLAKSLRSSLTAHLLVLAGGLWAALTLGKLAEADLIQGLEAVAVFGLGSLTAVVVAGDGALKNRFGAGAAAAWGALFVGVSGFVMQFGVREFDTDPTRLWVFLAGFGVIALTGALVWRTLRATIDVPVAAALAAAGATFAVAPRLTPWLGHPVYAEMIVGAAFFITAVAGVVVGSRDRRRGIFIVSTVAFIAEALYVYFRTFGGLMTTSAFFLVGGVLMSALAVILLRAGRKATGMKKGAAA